LKVPLAMAKAATNVKVTPARSNNLAALSRATRRKPDDMVVNLYWINFPQPTAVTFQGL
jgi:ribosomal protein L15E